jgi:hypothetical protein
MAAFSICVAKPLRPAQLRDAIDSAMSGPAVRLPEMAVTQYEQEQDPAPRQRTGPASARPDEARCGHPKVHGRPQYLERILYKFQDQSDETFKRIIQCLNARDKEAIP